jgi:uncharacterized protein
MFDGPRVSMLRLQATPTCNLNCSYCYIPESVRRGAGTMSDEVLEACFARLIDEDLLEDRLTVSWHGAEPLAAGLGWYERAFDIIDRVVGRLTSVTHTFQTNGVLISDAWCEFFRRKRAVIGVSLDGDAEQNAARVNWSGRPAYNAAARGVQLLNKHGLPWTLLSVITAAGMRDPETFIQFVRSIGCSALGFKVEETNIAHESDLGATTNIEARYAAFVQHLWQAFPSGDPIRIREFDDYRAARQSDAPRQALPVTVMPLRNITVAANGDFTIFSGELLFREDNRFVFGNVLREGFLDSLHTDLFRSVGDGILAGARRCAQTCDFYSECGSFYVSQKYSEKGTFDADETTACRLEIKTLFTALDDFRLKLA